MKQSVESSHADDVLQQVGRRLRGRDEMGEDFFVLFPMQEKRVCRLTVASRSADLLVVGDEVLQKLEMNDETDVRLVIPHAQLHGGGKHPGITGHEACDEERHRHQEQVKRGAGKRSRGTRRRRQRPKRGATGVSALSNSQNIAKLLTRLILRVVLLPRNEVKPASGITACELPSSEKLRQSKMASVL